nr:MAG TPA: NAD-dependent protein deacetylase sirtuin-1 [Caudoviricetes sp.]
MRCILFEKLLSPPNRMIFPNAYCIYPADRV